MECLEAALKTSFWKDMALKQTLLLEEFSSAFNVQNVVASSDDFFLDDLLNLSLLENNNEEPDQQHKNHDSTPQNNQENYNYNLSFNNLLSLETAPSPKNLDSSNDKLMK